MPYARGFPTLDSRSLLLEEALLLEGRAGALPCQTPGKKNSISNLFVGFSFSLFSVNVSGDVSGGAALRLN